MQGVPLAGEREGRGCALRLPGIQWSARHTVHGFLPITPAHVGQCPNPATCSEVGAPCGCWRDAPCGCSGASTEHSVSLQPRAIVSPASLPALLPPQPTPPRSRPSPRHFRAVSARLSTSSTPFSRTCPWPTLLPVRCPPHPGSSTAEKSETNKKRCHWMPSCHLIHRGNRPRIIQKVYCERVTAGTQFSWSSDVGVSAHAAPPEAQTSTVQSGCWQLPSTLSSTSFPRTVTGWVSSLNMWWDADLPEERNKIMSHSFLS